MLWSLKHPRYATVIQVPHISQTCQCQTILTYPRFISTCLSITFARSLIELTPLLPEMPTAVVANLLWSWQSTKKVHGEPLCSLASYFSPGDWRWDISSLRSSFDPFSLSDIPVVVVDVSCSPCLRAAKSGKPTFRELRVSRRICLQLKEVWKPVSFVSVKFQQSLDFKQSIESPSLEVMPGMGAGSQCGYPNFCQTFVFCLVFVQHRSSICLHFVLVKHLSKICPKNPIFVLCKSNICLSSQTFVLHLSSDLIKVNQKLEGQSEDKC